VKLDAVSGLLNEADYIASPNHDERPEGTVVSLIVVHGISLPPGEFGGPWINDFFTNNLDSDQHPYFAEISELKVSSHFLIRRNGDLIQYVPVHQRAWHAGQSSFEGCSQCNDFSIGIELEGEDHVPYDDRQYASLIALIALLMRSYPAISMNNIVGHADIAPGRKTDPGVAFDWSALRKKLAARLASSVDVYET